MSITNIYNKNVNGDKLTTGWMKPSGLIVHQQRYGHINSNDNVDIMFMCARRA